MSSHERRQPLSEGWEAAACAPDSHLDPAALGDLEWIAASVPGTAAAALCDAGRWRLGEEYDFDAEDWWFRTRFEAEPAQEGEEVLLRLDGIATVSEVYLDGALALESNSMFAAHAIDLGPLLRAGGNELAIRCRALGPLLAQPRKPRARWRTRLVGGGLRFFRTMLLGRAPGIAPGPAAVGPWRPVRIERRRVFAVERLGLRPRLEGEEGVVELDVVLRSLDGQALGAASVEISGPSGEHRAMLAVAPSEEGAEAGRDGVRVVGSLSVPEAARWWPHTHGEPALHEVRLRVGETVVDAGRVGFRTLAPGPDGHDLETDGLDLRVNGVRVFARGAIWTPVDPVGLAPSEAELRSTLEAARDAGMNMLRVAGIGSYESEAFHDLCDELGILVWQDFMFANLDYPIEDEGFRAAVEHEVRQQLELLAGRPSLAVLCGNSEVEQQAAMMGLDPSLGRGELFGELLPRLLAESGADAAYVPSAPCGGEMPFHPGRGIANYFGVGGYRRPLSDARSAGVRFASECLALANVADGAGLDDLEAPRDAGAEWDFGDVRDHYLAELHGVDPTALREHDPERYLALSREVSGEVMAAVFGEWRRAGSPCNGGLVLWLRDLAPGAGWGLLDSAGRPKAAYRHLRRALAPTAAWIVDEGLGGLDVHLAHDRPEPLAARLRIALYRDFEQRAGEAEEELELPAHGVAIRSVEGLLGRFVDASSSYRFGNPQQDLVVASLEPQGGGEPFSRAFAVPAGRPRQVESAAELGLEAVVEPLADGAVLTLVSRRFVHGVRVEAAGYVAADDAFSLEPGVPRRLVLKQSREAADTHVGLTALNLRERLETPL
jgi:beta-mannosidase